MSTPPKRTESPPAVTKITGAESPTTARPLEMDDDDVQDTPLHQASEQPTTSTTQATSTVPPTMENAPPKPPRPVSAQQEAENTLKEAFPGVEAAVIKAVLIASGGKIEPAFNALLGMTDPEHAAEVIEEPAPPQPPRPSRGAPMSQLEADELYARQLAQQYDTSNSANRSRSAGDGRHPQNGQHIRPAPRYQENDDYNFIDDELPVIKENLRKGFLETQSKVNGWITNLKKRIDGDDISEINAQQQRHAQGGYQSPGGGSSQQGYNQRRSGDADRRSGDYDADPHVLSDDFAGINMNDDTSELHHAVNPRTSSLPNNNAYADNARRANRPMANPDLFKAQPAPPRGSGDARRVSFQDPAENDLYSAPPVPKSGSPENANAGKQSKWQPLSSVEPTALRDEENDPFSLGDSDDEREAKEKTAAKEEGAKGGSPAVAGAGTSAAPPAPSVEDTEGKKLA